MNGVVFTSFADRVAANAAAFPDRLAAVCDAGGLTYGALVHKAQCCAGRLQQLGLTPGGKACVGLIASDSLDFIVVVMACQFAGVTVAPLPGLIAPDAQARMIDDAGVAILFYDDDHAEKALTAIALSQRGAGVRAVRIGTPTEGSGDQGGLDAWVAAGEALFTPAPLDAAWAADLIYSSGTTGTPKGILQSYGARAAACVDLARLGFPEGGKLLHTVGLYSNFGLSGFLLALWWGGAYFTARKFSGPGAVRILTSEVIDMAWFAPATLIRTLESPGFEAAVHGKACVKVCAGAPLSEAHKQQVLDTWPGALLDVYGQTETGSLSLLSTHQAPASKRGSVGKILPSVQVRILDDDGKVVPLGEEGEIAGHSATIMSGYHDRPDANASTFWTDDEGRAYVRTGDVGRIDADGYLWLCDRKKDMIISGGFNIYPADIERVLSGHPAVFEVAVVGCPSERWGETPVAFLTLRDGASADEEELRTWANARLGSIQKVAAIRTLPQLPNGTMGKILKRELRERFTGAMGVLP